MNVLFIERNLVENVVFDQILRIKKYADITVLSINIGNYKGLKHPDVINVRCSFFPKLEKIKNYLFYSSALKAFEKIREQKFDIVHSHFAYPEGYAAYKLSQKYNIPFVITGRGSDILIYPRGKLYYKRMIGEVLNNCSIFIGVSKDIIRNAVKLGLSENKSFFIPDGISNDFFCKNKNLNSNTEKRTILFAGSFIEVKNILKLLSAFEILILQNINIILKLAGSGHLEAKLRNECIRSKVSENIVFLGQLSHQELIVEMQNADVLCLPSLSEGWPNVIMEAMGCGTPVVGANVGGIPEQIISEYYGYLCDPNFAEDIADKLRLALDKKNWNYVKISERGCMYNREDAARKILGIYKNILK